ncbi:MAG: TetR/AcrR family transcriptional regulator [Candidatus Paralactobacillus gallistercoris]|uniref:TetR/AcrR family transcriptional regulator n=1 Tax=Candidatus Paralactobacillus gallistercoris TaxID=2838724 RepID=A0A948X0R6_9LACO|nr:TetR/AcrR family transcriptional regulator [Candidatus Paralactobacillus gallistercoris]
MPSKTFLNLKNTDKKQRINQALLLEFSQYPLAQAQVARIIKNAGIARGAFYQYFDNLTDAYQYLLQKALTDIHADLSKTNYQNPTYLLDKMTTFINQVSNNDYFNLFKMHFKYNEVMLPDYISKQRLSTQAWVLATLSHATLRDIFIDKAHQTTYLQRFQEAIKPFKEDY